MRYQPAHVFTHDELVSELESGDPQRMADALISAVRYDDHTEWVQDTCLRLLSAPELPVRWSAATCLGDMAFIERPIAHRRVLAALYEALKDPQIADPVQVSIDLVTMRYPPD